MQRTTTILLLPAWLYVYGRFPTFYFPSVRFLLFYSTPPPQEPEIQELVTITQILTPPRLRYINLVGCNLVERERMLVCLRHVMDRSVIRSPDG